MSFVRQTTTRYGPFLYNPNDVYVGRSIELYGEAHELELEFLRALCGAGSYVFDIGANIGDHTVPLAQHVGRNGRIFAFEPQRIVFQTLCGNVALAELDNVEAYQAALGAEPGAIRIPEIDYTAAANYGGVDLAQFTDGRPVPVRTLDEFLDLSRVDLLKIDVEGMERAVLTGGKALIEKFRPLMYVENDREERSAELISFLFSLRYRLFWHLPPLFNANNFRGNGENVFGEILSWNMLCVPAETPLEISGFEEVKDPRDRPFARGAVFNLGVADDERGRACVEAGDYEQAERLLKSAAARVPDRADPQANLAFLYHVLGRVDEALAAGERAVALEPQHVQSHVNLALSYLLAGDYERGFREYEWRPVEARFAGLRRWNGENLKGARLLVSREQGLGDFILYSRFFPALRERGARVCVEIPQAGRSLYQRFDGIDEVLDERAPGDLSRYAAYLPIASIPRILNIGTASVPAPVPYVHADPAKTETFAKLFRAQGKPRSVGIVWAGSPDYAMDRHRSVSLAAFDPLAQTDDVAWVSLQKGPAEPQAERNSFDMLRLHDRLDDFSDTAAAIAALDLVICVDTSVAHLAGALGKPVWLLNGFGNYWLWGLRATRTPWYPTMRLFHQPKPGDWAGLFEEVQKALSV